MERTGFQDIEEEDSRISKKRISGYCKRGLQGAEEKDSETVKISR